MTPEQHFPLQSLQSLNMTQFPRFINRFDSREILLVIDGSCVNNGRSADPGSKPVGGCSFLYKQPAPGDPTVAVDSSHPGGKVSFRLEKLGPAGMDLDHTSNRAKLRAVIAALQFRAWDGEGWRRVVILTDLEYIVEGATRLLPRWAARQWRGQRGRKIANRDLWEELQARVDGLRDGGCEVAFWLVGGRSAGPSEMIGEVKQAARRAARRQSAVGAEVFTRICGILT